MDQELIAYLDLRFTAIDQRFTAIDQGFTVIDQRFTVIDQRFTSIEERLSGQIEGLRQEMGNFREEMGNFREETTNRFERVEETIRHTQVTVEALHGKIGLVAEGVTGANERLDSFRAEVAHETGEIRRLIHPSYSGLDLRIRLLEGRRRGRKGQNPAEPL